MNLTDGANFPTALIKFATARFNQKINHPRETKQRIQENSINNGWNIQIVQILREILDGNFLFKGKLLSRLPKPAGLSHECIKKKFKYQEPEFYY